MLLRIRNEELVRTPIPLLMGLPIGVVSTLILRFTRGRRTKVVRLQRLPALIHGLFDGLMLFSMSTCFLRIAIESGAEYSNLPFSVYPGLLATYVLSGLAAADWSPSSIPRTQA